MNDVREIRALLRALPKKAPVQPPYERLLRQLDAEVETMLRDGVRWAQIARLLNRRLAAPVSPQQLQAAFRRIRAERRAASRPSAGPATAKKKTTRR